LYTDPEAKSDNTGMDSTSSIFSIQKLLTPNSVVKDHVIIWAFFHLGTINAVISLSLTHNFFGRKKGSWDAQRAVVLLVS
jgi:hypothetical protein